MGVPTAVQRLLLLLGAVLRVVVVVRAEAAARASRRGANGESALVVAPWFQHGHHIALVKWRMVSPNDS